MYMYVIVILWSLIEDVLIERDKRRGRIVRLEYRGRAAKTPDRSSFDELTLFCVIHICYGR